MKTLTSTVSTEAAAAQSGWAEVYDIYLKAVISTPIGNVDTLRLCTVPGGMDFFKPKIAPETDQGAAVNYAFWPMTREALKGSSQFLTDKMAITASNVTQEWAQMLADVDWYDVPVIIRKVLITNDGGLTSDDCVIVFSGQVDSAVVNTESVQLQCSNDMGSFAVLKPAWPMHENCRFNWGDDYCTAIRYLSENYKAKTVGAGSTKNIIASAGLTEDLGSKASYGTELVDALANTAFTSSSNAVSKEPYRVKTSETGASWEWLIADWGTQDQGLWQIPDAQSGLKNPVLKPWITINFGTPRACRLWRIKNNGTDLDQMPRLLLIFSSPDSTLWKFERYAQMSQSLGEWNEFNIPKATNSQWWRVCIRSRYVESNVVAPIYAIEAYENGRNYWANGTIRFDDNTLTPALRKISRTVLESYSGEVRVATLPAVPAAGDTFTIERGCPRTFNGCAERLNVENFGGFDSVPSETVIR